MREIKFRAWDKRFKKMWYNIHSIEFKNKEVIFEDNLIVDEVEWASFNDCELMQYTGLKDKKGKEIYEGDILKGNKNWEGKNFVVEWGSNMSHHSTGYTYGFFFPDKLLFENKEYEVMGNIHKNPELIKND